MNFSISPRIVVLVLSWAIAGPACADAAETASAASLQARYVASEARLGRNQFQRPLVLDSRETPSAVAGDIHALVNFPFESAAAALGTPADWCDILLLHLNTKSCRVSGTGPGTIEIAIRRERDRVHLKLTNPYHPEYQHRQGNRMALANIRERLVLHFDVEAKLESGVQGENYEIAIVIPYRKASPGSLPGVRAAA